MPIKSEKQRRAMQAAAHGHSTLGIPKEVAMKYLHKHHSPSSYNDVDSVNGPVAFTHNAAVNVPGDRTGPGAKGRPFGVVEKEGTESFGDDPNTKQGTMQSTPKGRAKKPTPAVDTYADGSV